MDIRHFVKHVYLGARGACIGIFARSPEPAETSPDSIRSILVIRIDRIGDVVISLPAIKALKSIFPNANISVLVQPSTTALIANEPYISETIPFTGFSSTIRLIRSMKFDMTVDLLMDYSIRPALIAYLSKAAVRAGYDIDGRGRLFNIAVIPDKKEKHMSEYAIDIVRSIGKLYRAEYRADWSAVPCLTVSAEAMSGAYDILSRNGIGKGQRIVCIHPGGYFPSQRWMPEAFALLADRITEKHGVKIVVIGSSSEGKLVEGVVSRAKVKPVYIVGRSLDVIAAIIKASELLICNNSGPLHIAAAVGTSTVSTLGPTVPHLWRPLGGNHMVMHHAVSCSPCSKGKCGSHECMKQISVDEMEGAVARVLEKPCNYKRANSLEINGEIYYNGFGVTNSDEYLTKSQDEKFKSGEINNLAKYYFGISSWNKINSLLDSDISVIINLIDKSNLIIPKLRCIASEKMELALGASFANGKTEGDIPLISEFGAHEDIYFLQYKFIF